MHIPNFICTSMSNLVYNVDAGVEMMISYVDSTQVILFGTG